MANRFSHWRSIPVRITAGFGSLLLILIAVSAVTWRAETHSEAAAAADKAAEQKGLAIAAVGASLAEIRLHFGDYLRTGAALDRDALNAALAGFDAALHTLGADEPGSAGSYLDAVGQATGALRTSLAAAVAAANERRYASDRLLGTAKEIQNALSALTAAAIRSPDRSHVDAAANAIVVAQRLLSAVSAYNFSESAVERQAALDATAELRTTLAAILTASADPPARLRRVVEAIATRLDGVLSGITEVEASVAARNQGVATMAASIVAAQQAMRAAGDRSTAERELRQEEVVAARERVRRTLLAAVGLGCLIGCSLAAAVGLSITRPLHRIARSMRELAQGVADTDVPGHNRHDEIGQMAAAVQVFKDNMLRVSQHAAERERLKGEAAAERRRTLDAMAQQFENQVCDLVSRLGGGAASLEMTAKSMTENASDTDQQASLVSQAVDQADMGMQVVAAAAEQLSASIAEINRQMSVSSGATDRAVMLAAQTTGVVENLVEAASRIDNVVSLISQIAGRTNLLALNATIEASRAGDAGRGFAVVASEVKTLADQTARATKDIGSQISHIQATTREAVIAIKDITQAVQTAGSISITIAAAVEQQGAATSEISGSVQTTYGVTQNLADTVGTVKQIAAETGQAAHRVLTEATDVASQTRALATEVTRFIATVRAA